MQNTVGDNEVQSRVGYDVNCCGVLVDRGGLNTEEDMTQAVKNIADEVTFFSSEGEMDRT